MPPARLRAPRPVPAPDHRGLFARQPTALKVLWTIWLVAVSVNVVVWVLVSGTSGHLQYPWPLWVAGPYGAALLAISVAADQFRRGRGSMKETIRAIPVPVRVRTCTACARCTPSAAAQVGREGRLAEALGRGAKPSPGSPPPEHAPAGPGPEGPGPARLAQVRTWA